MKLFNLKHIVILLLLFICNNIAAKISITPDIDPIPIYENPIDVRPKTYVIQNPALGLIYDVEILEKSPLRFKVELCISIINNEAKKDGKYYYHIVGWIDKTNCAYVKDIVANPASANNGSYRDNKAIEESREKLRVKNCIVLDFTSDSLQIMSRDGETLKIEWINNPKTF